MTFTVEPMLTAGTRRHPQWDDGWTEVDRRRPARAPSSSTRSLVTDDGVEILTVTADGHTAVAWPNAVVAAQHTA